MLTVAEDATADEAATVRRGYGESRGHYPP